MTSLRSGTRRLLTFAALLCAGAAVVSVVAPRPADAAVSRAFTPRFSVNAAGAIVAVGAPLLTCPTEAAGCLGALAGAEPGRNNNDFTMRYIDTDGDATTFNSASTTLSMPAEATVAWAGLYWGADTTAGNRGAAAPDGAARGSVRLRTPVGGAYLAVSADDVDTSAVSGGVRYQGFADVTDVVAAAGSGDYTVANVQAGTGQDRYGGWSLVVVYRDAAAPVRNLTVFDGYAVVRRTPAADQRVGVDVAGFLTPMSGPVRTEVTVVTYEGDRGLLGDDLRLGGTILDDARNPERNFFNGTMAAATPDASGRFPNALGFDLDHVNIDGLLANGSSSTNIEFTTDNDTYFPGVAAFQTELFAPRLDLAMAVTDADGGDVEVGDLLDYTVTAANSGGDDAIDIVFDDLVPSGTELVPDSVMVDGIAGTPAPFGVSGPVGAEVATVIDGHMPVGASMTTSFSVVVGEDAADLISNVAPARYVAATSQLEMSAMSNSVEVVVVRPAPPTTTVPETTVPETTVPATTTVPETTVPETTVPTTTTVPETTVPETTVPETTNVPTTTPTAVPETTVPTTAPTTPSTAAPTTSTTPPASTISTLPDTGGDGPETTTVATDLGSLEAPPAVEPTPEGILAETGSSRLGRLLAAAALSLVMGILVVGVTQARRRATF
jgi:uncharacterized repeat protein (TIGR01451 family)